MHRVLSSVAALAVAAGTVTAIAAGPPAYGTAPVTAAPLGLDYPGS